MYANGTPSRVPDRQFPSRTRSARRSITLSLGLLSGLRSQLMGFDGFLMMDPSRLTSNLSSHDMRKLTIPAYSAFGVVAAAALAVALGSSASAGAASDYRTIGQIPPETVASCSLTGTSECVVVGKVTGFQLLIDNKSNIYRVPSDGRIVAWGLTLGAPKPNQQEFFDRVLGKGAKASLAILRKDRKIQDRYRLVRQSQLIDLEPYFGRSPAFQFTKPLRTKKGDMIALSVPTWAPAFSVDLPTQTGWLADRTSDKCEDVKGGSPHESGFRRYQCIYRTARLLYWATLLPDAGVL